VIVLSLMWTVLVLVVCRAPVIFMSYAVMKRIQRLHRCKIWVSHSRRRSQYPSISVGVTTLVHL
jgi:hypothetical protein